MSALAVCDPKKCNCVGGRAQLARRWAETGAMARIAVRFVPSRQLSLNKVPLHEQPATNELRALCSEVFRWERCRAHMYVDSRGRVVTGVRHRLANAGSAAALPWRHSATGRPASRSEIEDAFRRVGLQGRKRTALVYRLASDLVLPAGVVGDLAMARIHRELLPGLRRLFRTFDRYPEPARRALVEMAFDLDIARLSYFRNLISACERGDFAEAADHCLRRGRRDARNAATRALFVDAGNCLRGPFVRRLVNGDCCG